EVLDRPGELDDLAGTREHRFQGRHRRVLSRSWWSVEHDCDLGCFGIHRLAANGLNAESLFYPAATIVILFAVRKGAFSPAFWRARTRRGRCGRAARCTTSPPSSGASGAGSRAATSARVSSPDGASRRGPGATWRARTRP